MTVTFEVLHSQWAAEDDVFPGGTHEISKPSKALLRLIAGGEAAGSVLVVEASDEHRALMDGYVQSQEDGEAALDAARGEWIEPVYDETLNVHGQVLHRELVAPGRWSGEWHDANVAQFELDVANGIRNSTLALNPVVAPGVMAFAVPVQAEPESGESA